MSYVALDLDNCKVLFKAPDMHSAGLLSGLKYADVTHCIFPVERERHPSENRKLGKRTLPKFLTTMECKMLWRNIVGSDWTSHNVGQLMDKLHEELVNLPEDAPSLFDLAKEAGPEDLPVDIGDWQTWKRPPHYAEVSKPHAPKEAASDPSVPWAIPAAPSAPTSGPRPPWEVEEPASAAPSLPWEVPTAPVAAPAVETLPVATNFPAAPKAAPTKGATARVWAIADQILKDCPQATANMKEFKKQVVEAAEEEGLNGGTAGTQFGKWKASKGL